MAPEVSWPDEDAYDPDSFKRSTYVDDLEDAAEDDL